MAKSLRQEVRLTVEARYLLTLPKDYARDPARQWPLVLFLHGSGERGTDLELVKHIGPPRLVAEGKEFAFILVAPQCPDSDTWSVEALRALLDELERDYCVDARRIYLTGLSMGGWATWNLAIAYPERFAAIAPVCGRTDRYMAERVCRVKDIPTWVFHGARDDIVPVSDSELLVQTLRSCGGKVQFTVYPEANHNAWDATYDNPALYEWLLSQQKSSHTR